MNKQELIDWKNKIEAMNSKKYVAIPSFDAFKGDMINISELSVLNKKESVRNVVNLIKLYYEKSILSALGSEKFDIANLYISIYLIAPNNVELEDRKTFIQSADFIDDCILVEPSVSILSLEDDEFVDVGSNDYKELLPNYVVSYKEFFEQMSSQGFVFDIIPFDELVKKVKNNDFVNLATCIVDFKQNTKDKNI